MLWEKAYRRHIDSLIEELDLSGNVVWSGPQPNDAVREFIRQSEVVIVPEQWENMSPVIVGEAMFNQRPVVGSRLGGIPDFVLDSKTGLLFEASSARDLSEKIVYLLKNKHVAVEMGKKGREVAEEIFSDDSIRKKYASLYMEGKK